MDNHKHIYDEFGLCFECDKRKPKSKAELMSEKRKRDAKAGLVQINLVVPAQHKDAIKKIVQEYIKHAE